jgi:hypothetical protein
VPQQGSAGIRSRSRFRAQTGLRRQKREDVFIAPGCGMTTPLQRMNSTIKDDIFGKNKEAKPGAPGKFEQSADSRMGKIQMSAGASAPSKLQKINGYTGFF